MSLENFSYIVPWSRFKKLDAAPGNSDMDAETVSVYKADNIKAKRNGNAIVFVSADVKISVDSRESWAVKGKMNPYLLKHEQGHFDITALAARTFYNEVLKLTATDIDALNELMKKLNADLQTKIASTNIKYDSQTDHSRNAIGQDKWNKALAAEKQSPYGSLDNLP